MINRSRFWITDGSSAETVKQNFLWFMLERSVWVRGSEPENQFDPKVWQQQQRKTANIHF